MSPRAALLCLIMLAAPAAARAQGHWSVVRRGDGAAAVYQWNGRPLFMGYCSADRTRLIVSYFGDGSVDLKEGDQIELLGDHYLRPNTHLVDGLLVAEIVRGEALEDTLKGQSLGIWAAHAVEEPWPVGSAAPLRRIAEACR